MANTAESAVCASVAIRVDASAQMGLGHIQRCLTLANALRKQSVRCRFICRFVPEQFAELIVRNGHDLLRLPTADSGNADRIGSTHERWLGASQTEDANQTARMLSTNRPDWLIVDHYGIDVRWEAALRPFTKAILIIDDLADRSHDCDVLLDQNYVVDGADRYASLVPAACRQMLGPRYALLRPDFAELRDSRMNRDGSVTRVLVFFGGADEDNYTALALDALDRLGRFDLVVDVVVGLMNPHRSEIETACGRRPNTRFFYQVNDIARLMAEADLALGAGGSATWERCSVGLPTLALVAADNQRRLTGDLCDFGAVLSPSSESGVGLRNEFSALLGAMLSSKALLRGMTRRCRDLVDGLGTQRVVGTMLSVGTLLRLATEGDCQRVYEWRNHPSVRGVSRVQTSFSLDSHKRWFAEALRNPDRLILVAECSGQPIGVVRFDIAGESSEVSVYLSPDRLAGGWGAEVLVLATQWLKEHRKDVREIVAEVLPENLASRGAFKRAGYQESNVTLVRRLA
jgi:UDP-2,4-diacetamido-2,4,6-trideoxy-beta-L-altropyranose hydrolase